MQITNHTDLHNATFQPTIPRFINTKLILCTCAFMLHKEQLFANVMICANNVKHSAISENLLCGMVHFYEMSKDDSCFDT